MKSGDNIVTLAGGQVTLPFANEHPCFGQRQGWCKNMATWRIDGEGFLLHFCQDCKDHSVKLRGEWTKMEERKGALVKTPTQK